MNIADDLIKSFNDGYQQGKRDAVVRGEWKGEYLFGKSFQRCSVCGTAFDGSIGFNYCGGCGSIMDGKDK